MARSLHVTLRNGLLVLLNVLCIWLLVNVAFFKSGSLPTSIRTRSLPPTPNVIPPSVSLSIPDTPKQVSIPSHAYIVPFINADDLPGLAVLHHALQPTPYPLIIVLPPGGHGNDFINKYLCTFTNTIIVQADFEPVKTLLTRLNKNRGWKQLLKIWDMENVMKIWSILELDGLQRGVFLEPDMLPLKSLDVLLSDEPTDLIQPSTKLAAAPLFEDPFIYNKPIGEHKFFSNMFDPSMLAIRDVSFVREKLIKAILDEKTNIGVPFTEFMNNLFPTTTTKLLPTTFNANKLVFKYSTRQFPLLHNIALLHFTRSKPWTPFYDAIQSDIDSCATLRDLPIEYENLYLLWRLKERETLLKGFDAERLQQCGMKLISSDVSKHNADALLISAAESTALPLRPRFGVRAGWTSLLKKIDANQWGRSRSVCLNIWSPQTYSPSCFEIIPHYCPSDHSLACDRLKKSDTEDEITLITQMSPNKLPRLVALAKEWTGPMSVAIVSEKSVTELDAILGKLDLPWERIDIHLVIYKGETRTRPYNASIPSLKSPPVPLSKWSYYPINFLRNVAIQFCRSDLIFIMDVDFVPIPFGKLYQELMSVDPETNAKKYSYVFEMTKQKHAFVVPAFEFKQSAGVKCSDDENAATTNNNPPDTSAPEKCVASFPQTKSDIIHLVNKNKAAVFHASFPGAHKPTNYQFWYQSNKPYYVKWSDYYEPYLILRKNDGYFPWFDERFVDRGRNKIILTTELHYRGYEFVALPDSCVIHSFETHKEQTKTWAGFLKGYNRVYKDAKRMTKSLYSRNENECNVDDHLCPRQRDEVPIMDKFQVANLDFQSKNDVASGDNVIPNENAADMVDEEAVVDDESESSQ